MEKILYEIIKEYILYVEGSPVKGRILKKRDKKDKYCYRWEISHYYRPSEKAAGVYHPSKHSAESFAEAELLLFAYMKGFSTIDVEINEMY